MSSTLSKFFSVTLTSEESTGEQVGFAYVDRQSDPLNLSLSGNEGSGRAYYTGKNFNIKGEKTPLATSTEVHHSNGVLAMQDGIWCSLIANSLYPSSKVSPVLAILDLNEDYTHPEKLHRVRRVKIIRLDLKGSLDRITHLFYLKKALRKADFLNMASQFGQLDAHKFMQRIVHGSWSNGNISPQGHLIDYDSVCAVKGRQPQFSAGSYYIDNYFSFEYVGKLKVLESMVASPDMNREHTELTALKEALISARDKEIALQLLYLMGFTDSNLFNQAATALYSLAELFKKLCAAVRYTNERSFFTNTPFHFFAHIFDFSTFFRYYPLLKLNNCFNVDAGFALLVESELIPEDETGEIINDFPQEPLEPRVLAYLETCFISSEEQIIQLKKEANEFIETFNTLFDSLLATNQLSLLHVAKKAYQVNEDRFYLFPVFDLSKKIATLALTKPASESNALIEQIIAASRRTYQGADEELSQTDTRIYVEGLSYIELTKQGHFRIIFEFNKQAVIPNLTDLAIAYKDSIYEATWKSTETEIIKITSAVIEFQELLVPNPRDEVFKLHKYEVLSQGKPIKLHDYFEVDPNLHYYL